MKTGFVQHINVRVFAEFDSFLELHGDQIEYAVDGFTVVLAGVTFEIGRYKSHFGNLVEDSVLMDAQEMIRLVKLLFDLGWKLESGEVGISEKWDRGGVLTLADLTEYFEETADKAIQP